MNHVIRSIVFSQILVLPGLALADDEEVIREGDREVVRKQTRLDFNDARIDGELTGPEGGYVPGSGRIRFRSLIELRQDFHEKHARTTESEF